MDTLTPDLITKLALQDAGPLVSIYLPTLRFTPSGYEENATRLRNLLRVAEQKLLDLGHREREASALLAPARALIEDRPFWLRATEGLGVLIGAEELRTYRLPMAPDESVTVGARYHIRPLLTAEGSQGDFWLLALSQKRVRLLRGTRDAFDEVPSAGIPVSLAEAMRWEDFEKTSLQFHTGTTGTGGRRPAVFHGTGEVDVKDELVRYFRNIDRGIRDLLAGSTAPLVLASVDYLVPLYHDVNTYPHLANDAVIGNPDAYSPEDLHGHAWALVEHTIEAARRELAAQIDERWASERTTPDPERIVLAAHHGRVESLITSPGAHWWGVLDPDAGRVEFHAQAEPGDEDLLDRATADTLANGGEVIALSAGEIPHGKDAVALLRY